MYSSSGAFTIAQQTAKKSHVTFATVDYTPRVDERGNPIWIVALQHQGEPTGTIYVGANHGTITRTEGLFSGGDRAAVMDEQTDQPNTDAEEDDADRTSSSATSSRRSARRARM